MNLHTSYKITQQSTIILSDEINPLTLCLSDVRGISGSSQRFLCPAVSSSPQPFTPQLRVSPSCPAASLFPFCLAVLIRVVFSLLCFILSNIALINLNVHRHQEAEGQLVDAWRTSGRFSHFRGRYLSPSSDYNLIMWVQTA